MRLSAFSGLWLLDRGRRGRARRPHRPAAPGRRASTPPRTGSPTSRRGRSPSPAPRPMRASRRYLWRDGGAGTIDVWFADGRFFHRFDAEDPAPAATTTARRISTACATTSAAGRAGRRNGGFTGRARTTASSRASARRERRREAARSPTRPRRLRAAGAAGAGAGARRALPPDARLPGPGDAGAALHAGRPGARLRGHQGRRSGQALRLADRAGHRGLRHRDFARADPTGGGFLALRLGAGRRTARRSSRPSASASRSTPGRAGPGPAAHPHLLRGAGRVRAPAQASIGPDWAAEPFLTLAGDAYNVRRVASLDRSPFLLLRELSGARDDMAGQSLAVLGGPAAASTLPAESATCGRSRRTSSTRTAADPRRTACVKSPWASHTRFPEPFQQDTPAPARRRDFAPQLDSAGDFRMRIGTPNMRTPFRHGRHRIPTRPDRSHLARRRRRPLGAADGPARPRRDRAGGLGEDPVPSGPRRCRSPSAPSRS